MNKFEQYLKDNGFIIETVREGLHDEYTHFNIIGKSPIYDFDICITIEYLVPEEIIDNLLNNFDYDMVIEDIEYCTKGKYSYSEIMYEIEQWINETVALIKLYINNNNK